VWLQRIPESGESLSFMVTQYKFSIFYWLREIAGVFFLIGLISFISSFWVKKKVAS
jgi:nitric oxide reductase subunit B